MLHAKHSFLESLFVCRVTNEVVDSNDLGQRDNMTLPYWYMRVSTTLPLRRVVHRINK